ncbi:MAG: acyltransferase [Cellvibrionaceae bacterium]|nr:acyltransferase [Cellvibrionaceae bacterium]MCV6624662.1 acyltransferase [Cellvibrionaceae bacterium]
MPALTGLRGLAAIWVLLFHVWDAAGPREWLVTLFGYSHNMQYVVTCGWAGVQMLFVLSAFLLASQFVRANESERPQPAWRGYYLRRLLRVFPAYYLQLGLLLLIAFVIQGQQIMRLEELPYYLTMWFAPPPVGLGTPPEINKVWWTLPIELAFYLLLPFFSGLLRWRYRYVVFALSLLIMISWRWSSLSFFPNGNSPSVLMQLPGSFDSFGLGMVAALLHHHFYVEAPSQASRQAYLSRLKKLALAALLVLWGLLIWITYGVENYWKVSFMFFSWSPIYNSVAAVWVLLAAADSSRLLLPLKSRPVFYLGMISYGIYIWHYPIISWVSQIPLVANYDGYKFVPLLLLTLLFTFIAASASWHLLERRAVDFGSRLKTT